MDAPVDVDTANADALFPLPSLHPPSSLCPTLQLGVSAASRETVRRVLRESHYRWHLYLNDEGFHNHAAHHVLSVYALGASPPLIVETYERLFPTLMAAVPTAEPITRANYFDHLGKLRHYEAYRAFFADEVLRRGAKEVMEEFLFSKTANIVPAGRENQPGRMLTRLLAVLVHPFIHVGYGLEFGLPGILVEGLAEAATHPINGPALIPHTLFGDETDLHAAALSFPAPYKLVLEDLGKKATNGKSHAPATTPHALEILARVIADARLDPKPLVLRDLDQRVAIEKVCAAFGPDLIALADEWYAGTTGVDAVTRKLDEVLWMTVVMYGVAGHGARASAPGGEMNADFFLMHLVTSAPALPAYAAYLSPYALSLLVRTYFAATLAWYIARGRGPLPIADLYAGTAPPDRAPPSPTTTTSGTDSRRNAWHAILHSAAQERDEHLTKLQRALGHCAARLGATPPGVFAGLDVEGAEVLDGTVFVRVAGLTAVRIGWAREDGPDRAEWDRMGFFE